jgi:hypothetical protein
MANQLTTPGVLRLDTAAVISATNIFKIRLMVLIPIATPATAQIKNGAGQIIADMATPANGLADTRVFVNPAVVTGFELASISAGAVLEVYCI